MTQSTTEALLQSIVTQTLELCPSVEMHLFETPIAGIKPCYIGGLGYYDNRRHASRDMLFYLTINGEIESNYRVYKEIDVIVGIGKTLEKFYAESGLQVTDVRLPKSHNFSGIKYGYRRTRELFPDAKLPGRRGRKQPAAKPAQEPEAA